MAILDSQARFNLQSLPLPFSLMKHIIKELVKNQKEYVLLLQGLPKETENHSKEKNDKQKS